MPRRVGIVGFGNLGLYLFEELRKLDEYEVVFVWNRTEQRMRGVVPEHLVLTDLSQCGNSCPDLIVEVSHPSITAEYGPLFLSVADYMIGSPTAFADQAVLDTVTAAATSHPHGLYVPAGAFWGGHDVKKMADRGTLKGLRVTMKKHPSAFSRVLGTVAEKVKQVRDAPVTLFEGPVRDLCPLAPNNVNTMAAAAIAAHNLGFSHVIGCLVADPSLSSHIVEVCVRGPGTDENYFSVNTTRINPAPPGDVTGKQTYTSFLSSLLGAQGQGNGIHLC